MKWKALSFKEALSTSAECATAAERYCYTWVALDARKWYDIAQSLVVIGGEVACETSGTDDIAVKGVSDVGRLIHAVPDDLDYILEPSSLGTISNGVFTASDTAGEGTLTVKTKESTGVKISSDPVTVTVI